MFPEGVVYEGVSPTPLFFRGESGANDSLLPTIDNLLQLPFPQNPLTVILKEFRKYRPRNHRAWLEWVLKESRETEFSLWANSWPKGQLLTLLVLDQVREFRDRHWRFTKEYIIKQTKHPVATGYI